MIEAIIGLVQVIVGIIVAIFGAAAEALSTGGIVEAVAGFFLVIFELIFWLILGIVELIVALVQRRKPRKITRPRFRKNKEN